MARRSDPLPLLAIAAAGAAAWWFSRRSSGTSPATSNANVGPAVVNGAGPAPGRSAGDPRGVRNNNPGNVVYSAANAWQGQLPPDGNYCRFESVLYGLRAAFIILRRYHNAYGANTIDQIAARWAPAPANNPATYAANVSKCSGLARTAALNFSDVATMTKVMQGIICAENGASWKNYADGSMGAAFNSALAAG